MAYSSPILGLFYLIKSLPKFSVVFKKMFNLKQNHHIEELEDELVALKAAPAELEEKKEKD